MGACDVATALANCSGPQLLKAFASLTHRLDGGPEDEAAVRAQRDQVEAEILRRMR